MHYDVTERPKFCFAVLSDWILSPTTPHSTEITPCLGEFKINHIGQTQFFKLDKTSFKQAINDSCSCRRKLVTHLVNKTDEHRTDGFALKSINVRQKIRHRYRDLKNRN